LVAQPRTVRGALYVPGDIHELHGRLDHLRGREHLGQLVQSRVRQWHHADVRFDRGEGVVGRDGLVSGQGVEQSRLTDVGQTDNTKGQTHDSPVYGPQLRTSTALGERHPTHATRRSVDPARPLRTVSLVGMRCRNSSTWDTRPTTRPPARN